MNFKEKIEIDFIAFLKEGKFDFIKFGKTKEWIYHNFPNADDIKSINDVVYKNNIWLFGNIEFHFNKDQLFLIYSDNFHQFNGGHSLILKNWILHKPKLNLEDIIHFLNKNHIDFYKKTRDYGNHDIEIRLNSGIEFLFILEEKEHESSSEFYKRLQQTHQNKFQLACFSFMKK